MGSGKKGVEVQVALLTIDFTNLLREFLLPEPPSSGGKGQEGVIGNATSEQHPSYTAQGPHKIWATVSHFP